MRPLLKYVITAFIITSLAMATANAIASTDSTQYNTLDETRDFLSNVVGLDLTKYSLTASPYQRNDNTQAPDSTTRVLNEAIINPDDPSGLNIIPSSYYFKSDIGMIEVFSIFYGRQLTVLNIEPVGNTSFYIYANSPGTDLTDQASALLTRYAEFLSQKSGADTSFLTPMKNVLNTVNIESSTVNTTTGKINFQVSKNENNVTRLQWIYVDYGTIMNAKRVEMKFRNGDLVGFRDNWSLYKVSGPNVLSAKQAREIALDAAQKVSLVLGNANGEIITLETPDLSNAPYDWDFFMSACYSSDSSLNNRLSLDPLTLYPFWQFYFYFNETIADDEGIQVGVLGDTGAIFSSGPFGHLGAPPTTIDTSTGASAPDNSLGVLIFAVIIATLSLIVSVPIALRHKSRRRK